MFAMQLPVIQNKTARSKGKMRNWQLNFGLPVLVTKETSHSTFSSLSA